MGARTDCDFLRVSLPGRHFGRHYVQMIAKRLSLCHYLAHHELFPRGEAYAQRRSLRPPSRGRTVSRVRRDITDCRGVELALRVATLHSMWRGVAGSRTPAVARRSSGSGGPSGVGPPVTYVSDTATVRDVGTQQCPKCDSKAAKAATLTPHFAYLRCSDCGEVWVISERREFPRDATRRLR